MLLAIPVFLLVLMSGCALGSARFHRPFEETLPAAFVGLILALFLFGLAGALAAGVYVVLAAALAVWAAAGLSIRKRGFRAFAGCFFTPGFWLFLFLGAALCLFNYGRLMAVWDDFSHWGLVVKMMVRLDDFGTNPLAHSPFPDYPPGISLLQYFLQKLILLFAPGAGFTEWALYYAHQLLLFSFFLPFAGKLDFKRPYAYVYLAVLFLCPMVFRFYEAAYQNIYADTLMAALYACALAWILQGEKTEADYRNICLTLALLALFKGAGILLALLGAALLALTEFSGEKGNRVAKKRCLAAAGAALAPWLLWNVHVRLSGAGRTFSPRLDFSSAAALLGPDAYRLETLKNFIYAFLRDNLAAGQPNAFLYLTPVFLFILLSVLLMLLLRRLGRHFPERRRACRRAAWAVPASFAVCCGGICLAYLFSFSQAEALALASFDRYVGMVLAAGAYLLVLLAAELIRAGAMDGSRFAALVFCAQAALVPWLNVFDYVTDGAAAYSRELRAPYEAVLAKAEAVTGGEACRYYLISGDSFDRVILRYGLRPGTVQFDDMDQREVVWENWMPSAAGGAEQLSAEAWRQELKEGYDYVLLYQVGDAFKEEYAAVFEDPEQIQGESLYRVDKETGLLTLCG